MRLMRATLTQVYQRIAGQRKEDAGINTNIEINLDNIIINSTPFSGGNVFNYIKYSYETKKWLTNDSMIFGLSKKDGRDKRPVKRIKLVTTSH